MQQLETLKCEKCGSHDNLVKHGLSATGKQRYICQGYKCTPKHVDVKSIPFIPAGLLCPKCQSTDLRRNGKCSGNRYRYICKSCNWNFRFPLLTQRAKYKIQTRETAKTLMASNRVVHLSHIGVDSVNEIPCFIACEARDCDPIVCPKIDKWLSSPAIHVKEIEYSTYPDDFVKGDN